MIIPKEFSDKYKKKFLYSILESSDVRTSTALYYYAAFLNRKKLHRDFLPLYIEIIKTNNRYAIDALLKGYDARHYLDFIKTPNTYLFDSLFEILDSHKKNDLYPVTVKLICGLLKRFYRSGGAGYAMFPLTIANVNSLGKYLDESKGQNSVINRDILDIFAFISDIDENTVIDEFDRIQVAKQAGRIRSDFFDNKRSLVQSMTENTLGVVGKANLGIPPEGVYMD